MIERVPVAVTEGDNCKYAKDRKLRVKKNQNQNQHLKIHKKNCEILGIFCGKAPVVLSNRNIKGAQINNLTIKLPRQK